MRKILVLLLPLFFQGASLFAFPTYTPTPTPGVWPKDPFGRPAQFFQTGTDAYPVPIKAASGSSALSATDSQNLSITANSLQAAPAGTASDPQYVSGPALVGIQVALNAAPAGTPSDPGYVKLSKTAETGQIGIVLTGTAAAQYTQLLPAPGAGLKYSINWANWTFSNGCTCTARTEVLTNLMSGSTNLPTYFPFDIPATANNTGGSMLPYNVAFPYSFLVGGYNETLGIKFTASPANAVAGPCLFTLNLGYSIIQ